MSGTEQVTDELPAAMREEIDAHRRRVAADPRRRPDLAGALQRYGLVLGVHGHRKEARLVLEEAVALYRTDPGAHRQDLAAALIGLGNQLAELGRHEQALDHMREAVGLHREAGGRPLASALTDLGIALGEAGRHEEAAGVLAPPGLVLA
ncbi:tetratricopeptide repeat protein [Dactylosporangium sp. NPDC000244]|uniref:tetratricopeptide repeat protein n=1 Tax=Dactylosporangium sp. NPDC000244 TaxID=3154365 RepID=UPI003318FB0B